MRFFKLLILGLTFSMLLSVSSFAVNDVSVPPETLTAETEVEGSNITVNVVMPEPVSPDALSPAPDAVQETPVQTFATYSLDAASSAVSNTMSSLVSALFGEYTPKTQTVTENLADGTSVTYQQYVPGVAGLDWHWLAGVMLFSLCLWSFLQLAGGVLKRV